MFTSDVTGNYFSYHANAIGESDDKIKDALRDSYTHDLTIKKGVKLALKIFKDIQGNRFNLNRFELSFINKEDQKIEKVIGEKLKDF